MYNLRLNKKELGDLISLLFFDKLFKEDIMTDNEDFNVMFEKMITAGIKPIIFSHYFNIEPTLRSKYKRFRDSLENEGATVNIRLTPNEEQEEE